jgi:regulatory protein
LESETSRLYTRALRLLARRNHTRFELRRKLLARGTSQGAEEVLDRLEQEGLIDDQACALQRALDRRQRGLWGDRRITQDLKRLGIDARMIPGVLEQVNDEKQEADSLREAVQLWVGKTGTPEVAPQLKKLYDHCVRLGYAPAQIRGQLEPYFQRVEWQERPR